MKSLFIKTLFVFSLFCNNTLAQKVTYVVESEEGIIGLAFFHYKPNGYEAIFGKNKVSLDISKDFVTETFEDFIITISLTGEYYHDYFGMWRTTHVATSKGQKGFAKMFYEGDTKEGRSYYAELWFEGETVSKSRTVVDKNGQIVSRIVIDETGLIRIKRN